MLLLGWVGLGWVGLGWDGMGWVRLGWYGGWVGMGCVFIFLLMSVSFCCCCCCCCYFLSSLTLPNSIRERVYSQRPSGQVAVWSQASSLFLPGTRLHFHHAQRSTFPLLVDFDQSWPTRALARMQARHKDLTRLLSRQQVKPQENKCAFNRRRAKPNEKIYEGCDTT